MLQTKLRIKFIRSSFQRNSKLWQENKGNPKDDVPIGYTEFCDDYSRFVTQNNLANHISHKPSAVCEVAWICKTMRLHATEEDKVIMYTSLSRRFPYSQLVYVELCLNMNEQIWINFNIHIFEYFGYVTLRIVCENLKTSVIPHLHKGDIILNQCY